MAPTSRTGPGARGSAGASSTQRGSTVEEKALFVIQCLLSRFSLIYDIQIQKKKKKKGFHILMKSVHLASNTMEITARLTAHWSLLSEGTGSWPVLIIPQTEQN